MKQNKNQYIYTTGDIFIVSIDFSDSELKIPLMNNNFNELNRLKEKRSFFTLKLVQIKRNPVLVNI